MSPDHTVTSHSRAVGYQVDYGSAGVDIVQRTPWVKGTNLWKNFGTRISIGTWFVFGMIAALTDDSMDPDWLIEGYWREYKNEPPCYNEDCVHKRVEKIKKLEEMRRKKKNHQNNAQTNSDSDDAKRDEGENSESDMSSGPTPSNSHRFDDD